MKKIISAFALSSTVFSVAYAHNPEYAHVATGQDHVVALKCDGEVWAW